LSKINHEKLNKNKLVKSSVARRKKQSKINLATDKQKELMNKLNIEYTKYTEKHVAMRLIKDKIAK
jgi:predicted metalloenzyme YecM